ncbi:MAG: serine hydrolase [Rhodobacterales bacterium]|nr:MAG: serine hydrolase [Rhodobacterales bacterium]
MARNREIGRYSGSSLIIARDGEVAHSCCDGMARVDEGMAYAPDTITRIYSMTKMVTSAAFAMLLERGLVHLNAPVSAFLPEFSDMCALVPGAASPEETEPAAAPTLAQLLTHTSGMTYSFNPGLAARIYEAERVDFGPRTGGLAANCARAARVPLAFQPGARWEYSVGIDIIGRVIEVIAGKPLDAVLQEWIFDPLGMGDTGFHVPLDKLDRFAHCYNLTEDNPLALLDSARQSAFAEGQVSTLSGGGGLVSTLGDYLKFGEMIRRGGEYGGARLLAPRTVAFMRRNHLSGDIASMGAESFAEMPMTGMGFGIGGAVVLDPARSRSPGSIGDFGWGGMASTNFWTDPVERLSVVYFTQLVPSSSYSSRAELKALVHAALA